MSKLRVGIAAFVLFVVLAIVSLPFIIDANQFRPRLEAELTTALGREVKVGSLKLDIFGGTVSADELSVADDKNFSTAPFLHARSLKLTVDLWTLISSRKLNVLGLLINQPEIALIQSAKGDWNFSGIGAKKPAAAAAAATPPSSGLDLSVKLIQVTAARLAFSQLGGPVKPQALESMDAEIRDFTPTGAFPFTMSAKLASGGDIHLEGKAGPMNSTDAASTPVEVALKITNLQMAASGLIDKASGIDGKLSIEGKGTSNGQLLKWNGSVRVEQLKLVPTGKPASHPVAFDFTLAHNVRTHSGVLSRGDIHLGNAPAHLTGNYAEHGATMSVQLHLAGTGMPVSELIAFLPPLDVHLPAGSTLQGGTAAIDATVEGPVTALVTDASMSVEHTKLANYDLGSKLAAIEKMAGLKPSPDTVVEEASAKVHVLPDQSETIQDLKLVIAGMGELNGAGTVDKNHQLDFTMRATVHTSGALLAALGQKGDTVIPFFIVGTSQNPSFRPDLRAIANEQIKRLQTNENVRNAVGGILGGLFGGGKKK